MKIALVYFNLTVQAGGQRQFFSLAQELNRLGHQVVIYTTEFNPEFYPDLWKGLQIRVVSQPTSIAKLLDVSQVGLMTRVKQKFQIEKAFTEAAKLIANKMDKDFDVIDCHEDFAYKVSYFYKKLNPTVKVIWAMNNPPFMYLRKSNLIHDLLSRTYNFYKGISEKRYFKSVDCVTVLSRYELAWAKSHSLPAQIIWSGVDFESFFAPVKETSNIKSFQLVAVGALNPYRRYEDILYAAGILRERGYDVRTAIVCKDMWNQPDCKAKLLSIVKEKSLEPYVQLYFDGVTEAQLRQMYASSHVYVLATHIPPPQGYGWGLSVFEAVAAGLPVVICRSSGAADVLADGANALLVDPYRPGQIASQVKKLIDDPSYYSKVAQSGQQFVKENISWSKYAEKQIEVFKGVAQY